MTTLIFDNQHFVIVIVHRPRYSTVSGQYLIQLSHRCFAAFCPYNKLADFDVCVCLLGFVSSLSVGSGVLLILQVYM